MKNKLLSLRLIFFKKDIDQLSSISALKKIHLPLLRKQAKILVIDDDVQCRLHDNLKKYHYGNVCLQRDLERIEDVSSYDLVICDIKGIGRAFSTGREGRPKYEGLSVVKEIKRMYPQIKVLVYSALKSEYEGNYIAETIADGFFDKDLDHDNRNGMIDEQLQKAFCPINNWKIFREWALKEGGNIHEIAKLESYYVYSIQKGVPADPDIMNDILSQKGIFSPMITSLVAISKFLIQIL